MTNGAASEAAVTTDHFLVDNRAGWRLGVTRRRPSTLAPKQRPVLIVPGYGMNSFIFGFHPNGPSFVDCLAARGLEVWTVDLRGQGRSIRARGTDRFGLADLAVEDLGAALRYVVAATNTGSTKVDVIGCSLGVAIALGHAAVVPNAPIHAFVSMAGCVTWRAAHPLVRLVFGSPRVAGLFRVRNTRRVARFALPVVVRIAPRLLSVYLNPQSTDLSQSARLVQTVEDPHPILNREIAEWIARGDLVLRGVNVSRALATFQHPFFCVIGNQDGIVPLETSRYTYELFGSKVKRILYVGDEAHPVGHADMFLCNGAQDLVFNPVADFLLGV